VEARNPPKHDILGQAKKIQIIQIQMFKILAILPENGFFCAPHQIAVSAYLVRDYAVLRYLPFLWRL